VAVGLSRQADASQLDLLLRYCDAQLAAHQADPALQVWNTLAARRIIPYGALDPRTGASLTNGDLAAAPLLRGFDWRPTRVEGAALSFDTASREMSLSLSGKQPESCEYVEQYLPVVPKVKYCFRYRYRTQDLADETGIAWSFVDGRTAAELAAGAIRASAGWNERTIEFSTGQTSDLLRVLLRYRRPPGRVRAEGSVVFTRFILERAG
jgi:hypothetical protein